MRAIVRAIPVLVILLWMSTALVAEQPWQPIGPDGGNVRSLAIDPKDPDRIFLGTSAGKLFQSVNGTDGWEGKLAVVAGIVAIVVGVIAMREVRKGLGVLMIVAGLIGPA